MKRLLCFLALCAFTLACTPDDPEPTPQPTPEVTPTPEPEPEPEPVDGVNLPHISGLYFGNQYSADEDSYNYLIALSTAENCYDIVTGDMILLPENTYLILDLYSSLPSRNYNVSFSVPAGEYVFDPEKTLAPGTVGSEYTYLYVTDEDTGTEIHFKSGKVIVTDERLEAEFLAEDGAEYHFYTEALSVDNSLLFTGDGFEGEFSTLEGNLLIPFEDPAIYAECLDDYYVIGKNDWVLYIDDYATGHSLILEILAPLDESLPLGEFNVSDDLELDRMVLPGYVNGYGEGMWSWYQLYDENGLDVLDAAPVKDGILKMTDAGNGMYTAEFDFTDDAGNRISGKCTAALDSKVWTRVPGICRPARK